MRSRIASLLLGVRGEPPNRPNIPIRTQASNVLGFLWRHKQIILILTLFLSGFLLLRGCVPDGLLGKSKDALALEARLAQQEARFQAELNERDAEIADIARDAALNHYRLQVLSEQGRNEIDAATPLHEEPIDPGLERAWRASIVRLYDNAGADAPSVDSGGPGA